MIEIQKYFFKKEFYKEKGADMYRYPQLILLLAMCGFSDAQHLIGFIYNWGEGFKLDLKKAAYWYTKAAKQGHRRAQWNIGFFYEVGHGVEKNDEKAIYWYTLSANQGYNNAKASLRNLKKRI